MNAGHFFLQIQVLEIPLKTSGSSVQLRPTPLCAVAGTQQGKVPQG